MGLKSLSLSRKKTPTSLRKAVGIHDMDLTPNPINEPWARNPTWLTLPTVTSSEDKTVGLIAVYDTAENNVVIRCATGTVTSGLVYQVDWGDGTVDQAGHNVNIEHAYDYNDVALANTDGPVTFGSNLVTRNNHGYSDNDRISFYISDIADVEEHVRYHVVNSTTNTFQLALTEGGTPITIGTGTGTILPYKQAIVTVTPINGATISWFDVQQIDSRTTQRRDRGWLEFIHSHPSMTSDPEYGNESARNTPFSIEQITMLNVGNNTNWSSTWRGMYNLASLNVDFGNTTATAFNTCFYQCRGIKTIPDFNMSLDNNTTLNSLFSFCYSLRKIPVFTGGIAKKITGYSSAFNSCYQIREIPEQYTEARTDSNNCDLNSLASSCYNLQWYPYIANTDPTYTFSYISTFNNVYKAKKAKYLRYSNMTGTGANGLYHTNTTLDIVQTVSFPLSTHNYSIHYVNRSLEAITVENNPLTQYMSNLFGECRGLRVLRGELNIPNAIDIPNFLAYTVCLKELPIITTTSALTNAYSAIRDTGAKRVNVFDTSNCTDGRYFFYNCRSLEEVPAFDFSNMQNCQQMCQYAYVIKSFLPDNLSSITNANGMFTYTHLLENVGQNNNTLNLPNTCTNITSMFNNASSIRHLEITANGPTTINAFAYNARMLTRLKITATAATSAPNAFTGQAYGNWGNIELIEADLPAMGANQSMFTYSTSLKLARLNIPNSFSLATLDMSGGMLDYLYTHLPTVSGKTITITNNRGRTEDDPSIATAKGWTVTG